MTVRHVTEDDARGDEARDLPGVAKRHLEIIEVLLAQPLDLFILEHRPAHDFGEDRERLHEARRHDVDVRARSIPTRPRFDCAAKRLYGFSDLRRTMFVRT